VSQTARDPETSPATVAGLALAAAGIQSLAVPQGVDRAAIFVPSSPQADTA
jgi:hypothetical protein